jgi:hypothetical protein
MAETLTPSMVMQLPAKWQEVVLRNLSFEQLGRLLDSCPEGTFDGVLGDSIGEGFADLLGAEEDD